MKLSLEIRELAEQMKDRGHLVDNDLRALDSIASKLEDLEATLPVSSNSLELNMYPDNPSFDFKA